jgi:hypothetical protein
MKFDTLEELIEFRNKILSQLYNNVCLVSFLKKDGDTRVMLCTTSPDFVPVVEKKTDRVKKSNPYVISAFDLNKNAYRSFLVENILDMSIVNPKDILKYVVKEDPL